MSSRARLKAYECTKLHITRGVFKAKFAKVCQDRAFRAKAVSDCPKVLQSLVSAVEKLGRGKVMKAQERETLFQSAAELRNESRLRSEGSVVAWWKQPWCQELFSTVFSQESMSHR